MESYRIEVEVRNPLSKKRGAITFEIDAENRRRANNKAYTLWTCIQRSEIEVDVEGVTRYCPIGNYKIIHLPKAAY